jgi:hypothetical protein
VEVKKVIKKIVKAIVPYGIVKLYEYIKPYTVYYKSKARFHVYSIEETIDKIITDKCSIVRFGDGEMALIMGKGISFQEYDETLAHKLREILCGNEKNLLVLIPDIFEGFNKYGNRDSIYAWKKNLLSTRGTWEKLCIQANYYNAFITRPYMIFQDKMGKPLPPFLYITPPPPDLIRRFYWTRYSKCLMVVMWYWLKVNIAGLAVIIICSRM